MKITFVGIGWEQLSISLLSALAKQQGHDVSLAFSASLFNDRYNLQQKFLSDFFDEDQDLLQQIQKQSPDVVVFSPVTATYQWMLHIAKEVKILFPGVKNIFGGVHVSVCPDHAISQEQVDYVCIGEGDLAFPEILESIEKHQIRPITNTIFKSIEEIIKGPQGVLTKDLSSLPMFDKTIWEEHMFLGDIYFTLASRGCPFQCTYCFNSYYSDLHDCKRSEFIRYRSVDHVMEELKWAKNRYKLRVIEFEDDVFTMNKKWLKKLLDRYEKEIDVPFQCLSHPSCIDDEISKWLADAGCVYVQMGVQSMDSNYKKKFLKRNESSDQVYKAMESMHKYGIKVKVDHMFGLPKEPIEAQEKALKLYKLHSPYRIQTFWTNLLPGTEMVDLVKEQGLVSDKDIEALNRGDGIDYYRQSSLVEDDKKNILYKKYETIFKLMMILPKGMHKGLSVDRFRYVPLGACSLIGFISDVLGGLLKKNPDHIGYAKFYIYHVSRIILRKIGIKLFVPTQPKVGS